jgi:hypothetical protein
MVRGFPRESPPRNGLVLACWVVGCRGLTWALFGDRLHRWMAVEKSSSDRGQTQAEMTLTDALCFGAMQRVAFLQGNLTSCGAWVCFVCRALLFES